MTLFGDAPTNAPIDPHVFEMRQSMLFGPNNGTNLSLANSTWTNLTNFQQEDDQGAMANPSTGEITIPVSGYYLIGGEAAFAPFAGGSRAIQLLVNNSGVCQQEHHSAYDGGTTVVNVVYLTLLSAGDVLRGRVVQNSGGALNLEVATTKIWAMMFAAGSATAIGLESANSPLDRKVVLPDAVLVSHSGLGSTASGEAQATFNGMTFDTASYWDSGVPYLFTVPSGKAGLYLCGFMCGWTPGSEMRRARLMHNLGSTVIVETAMRAMSGVDTWLTGAQIFPLAVGDTVHMLHEHKNSGNVANVVPSMWMIRLSV